MKLMRPVIVFAILSVWFSAIAPAPAGAQHFPFPVPGGGRVVVAPRAGRVVRSTVVVNPGWPLKRAPRPVIVRPRTGVVRPYVAPRVYLPAVVFGGVVVGERRSHRHGHDEDRYYSRENLVWQDSETLYREDDWTEFTFDCNARGTKLWFEVNEGRVQVDWAEVVFESGEVQVVEFPERSFSRGIYELQDFRSGRRIDTVRMVAKTTSREATLTLWMER